MNENELKDYFGKLETKFKDMDIIRSQGLKENESILITAEFLKVSHFINS